MKFLMILLGLQLLGELISNRKKLNEVQENMPDRDTVLHPAEFELR